MKTGQIFLVPIKTLKVFDPSQQTVNLPLEVEFQQFSSDQARIDYTSAVLSVPVMVPVIGTCNGTCNGNVCWNSEEYTAGKWFNLKIKESFKMISARFQTT